MPKHLDAYKTTGSSPPTRVTVTHVEVAPGSTVGIGHGLAADGREFLFGFGGNQRLMLAISGAVEAGQLVEVLLDGWSLIGWSTRP